MNTYLCYQYRDASNYKTDIEFVLSGSVGCDDLQDCLDDGEYFIPSQVGLPDIQDQMSGEFPTDDDHVWHELLTAEPTDAAPTWHMSAREILALFKRAATDGWDEAAAAERLGIAL
jgi:hypothetical protein